MLFDIPLSLSYEFLSMYFDILRHIFCNVAAYHLIEPLIECTMPALIIPGTDLRYTR